MSAVRFLAEATDLILLHSVQTGSGAHPASYLTDTGASVPESDRGEMLTIHLHLVQRLRMMELYLHSPIFLPGVVINYMI
jgi:hypothetical protein